MAARKGVPVAPRVKPTLTDRQRERLQPFLRVMLKRYADVAATGSSTIADPLCAKTGKLTCCDCPVFGIREFMGKPGAPVPFIHCSDYLPDMPGCVSDNEDDIACATGGKNEKANLKAAKAWGAAVVEWLEGQRV